jgi:glycosyltransferase involved in cell wall biosynthesis
VAAIIKHFLNVSRDNITLNLMEVLSDMGFNIELVTNQRSDLSLYWRNSGKAFPITRYRTLFPFTMNDTFTYERFITMMSALKLNVDLAIDAHGDLPPYLLRNETPLIVYLLWPVTAYLNDNFHHRYSKISGRMYLYPYKLLTRFVMKLLRNPFYLIAITQYVKSAIERVSGLESVVIYPPVDIRAFASVLNTTNRSKTILVLARISPEKLIERSIRILKIVNEIDGKWQLIVAGSLNSFNNSYYNKLRILSKGLPVTFKANATRQEVLEFVATSSIYLHTMLGEHFGRSVIEAMAAGLVPVVHNSGGPREFVPLSLQYRTEEEAAEMIVKNGDVSDGFRQSLSRMTETFSEESFQNNMKRYLHSIGF